MRKQMLLMIDDNLNMLDLCVIQKILTFTI